jgi:hypothetical protein
MRKPNGKHPAQASGSAASSASAETHEAEYRAAVEEGKAIIAQLTGKQWELGDLAAKVEKVYGENRLKQFAEDINFPGNHCTLERYRPVCRAFPKTGVRPRFFASAQVLRKHPDRIQIVTANPEISKGEAREIMRLWRAAEQGTATPTEQTEEDDLLEEADEPTATGAEQPEAKDLIAAGTDTGTISEATSTPAKAAKAKGAKKAVNNDEWSGQSKRWQSEVVVVANNAIDLADTAIDLAEVRKRCTPEQRRDLFAVFETAHIATILKAGEAFTALGEWLSKLSDEASDEAIEEGLVKTAPAPAPQALHAGA